MANIIFNNAISLKNYNPQRNLRESIFELMGLRDDEYYFIQNGKILQNPNDANPDHNIHCILRILGGKGGFGSMLRAIGAQIEKTTNREACRDLSGRRLRDINEEKRLKSWLEKQADREREAEERKKKKIEKLLHVPKHEFKDEKYEDSRQNLTEKVNDAVEEGLNRVLEINHNRNPRKRAASGTVEGMKEKRRILWLDETISSSDSNSDDEKNIEKVEAH